MNHEWTRIKETLNRGIVESDFYRFNAFNVYNGLTRLCPNQSPSRSGFDESNQIKPNQTKSNREVFCQNQSNEPQSHRGTEDLFNRREHRNRKGRVFEFFVFFAVSSACHSVSSVTSCWTAGSSGVVRDIPPYSGLSRLIGGDAARASALFRDKPG